MISNAFCASTGVASISSAAIRIKAPRFIFLPERANLRPVYAPPHYGTQVPVYLCVSCAAAGGSGSRQHGRDARLPRRGGATGTVRRPYSHVGIYLGDGNFVHAPRRGQRVRVESINSPYWRARFNGARRLDPPVL